MPALLALTLTAVTPLWVTTQGFEPDACNADAFAAAVRAQRPSLDVHAWHPELNTDWPPPGAIRVRLMVGDSVTLLEVTGGKAPLSRRLPAADGCERNLEIAALIVDGALDSLDVAEAAPEVESLAPPVPLARQLHLGAMVGAGVEQGPLGPVAALDVGGSLRFRFYELTLDADIGLPASRQFQLQLPESGSGAISVTMIAAVLGLGVAPELGPGHLFADVLLGVSLPLANTTGTVFQQSTQVAPLFFSGLRVGYLADLPAHLFVGARLEERVGLTSAFVVDNGGDNPTVTTRTWTFEALGLLGYHFF